MAVVLKNGNGTLSISEVNGKLSYAIVGNKLRALSLTEDEIKALWNAYNVTGAGSVEETFDNLMAARGANKNNEKKAEPNEALVRGALTKLINFFTEFQFTPSFRFVNTLCNICKTNVAEANAYVGNYFKLMDSPYSSEVCNKIKSNEFRKIITALADNAVPTKTINSRLRIFYGAQGTGKTTEAMKYTQTAVVCNSAMQPCDLIEDFTFDDGKAAFHPSALVKAMENGETVLLDEMNLLPFDSMRFLQGICDGKTNFEWKGHRINIKEGFNIIGTMNLVVNGTTFGLPEPIVDRCAELREFTLTADALMGAI